MRIRLTTTALLAVTAVLITLGASPASAGGGCRGYDFLDQRSTEVEMEGSCFFPQVARIDLGQTVTFLNEDKAAHAVTGVTASWGNADDIAEGESVAYAFDNPGVYPYFCILHPGMVGAIVVGDGVPVGEAAHITAGAASDDDGWSTALTAGIFAAIGFGGAALGMVGTRLVWRKS